MKRLDTVMQQLTGLGYSVYINKHDNQLTLSSENGNLNAFEYVNFDYPVALNNELLEFAKKAGYEWQCEYTGTYKLFPL
jgi:hypothetical protein